MHRIETHRAVHTKEIWGDSLGQPRRIWMLVAVSEQKPGDRHGCPDFSYFIKEDTMGTSRSHANAHHKAKADAALAMAVVLANQQVMDKVNGAVAAGLLVWLDGEFHAWQNAVQDTRSALLLASTDYDEIMAAEVKPNFLDAVLPGLLAGLTLTNPELGMLANILLLGSDQEKEKREKRAKRIMAGVELLKGA